MVSTIGSLVELIYYFFQNPIATIVILVLSCLFVYVLEQKAQS